MLSSYEYIAEDDLLHATYTLLAVTSLLFVARAGLRAWQRKAVVAEDVILSIAYLFFLVLSILYIVVAPSLYDGPNREVAKVPWSRSSSVVVRKAFFVNNIMLWCSLWTVKFAFLAMYRKLATTSRNFLRIWWALVIFCSLALIGAIVSDFTSCHSLHALWTPGKCATAQDERGQQASRYYVLAVDVLSDLLLILFPLPLLWKSRCPIFRRIGIAFLLFLGLACIATAFLRSVVARWEVDTSSLPTTSWFALWSIVEAAIAVIIGCCPGLYAALEDLYSTRTRTPASSTHQNHRRFDSRGYQKQFASHEVIELSMDDIVFGASRGHSRITSINGQVVGESRVPSRITSVNGDVFRRKHAPIPIPVSHGHCKSKPSTPNSHMWEQCEPSGEKELLTPVNTTPGVSKRNSKASLKYIPIKIPGTAGHRRDRTGSLSGAFWADMDESERAEMEEKAKEIKICVKDTRQVRMPEDERPNQGGRKI